MIHIGLFMLLQKHTLQSFHVGIIIHKKANRAHQGSTSIRINNTLYSQAKHDTQTEHCTISGQVEFWASVSRRAALDNNDRAGNADSSVCTTI